MKLFQDWSIAFTSKADLYLMRFDKNAERKVVTTNVTIKHFLKTLIDETDPENVLRNIRFTNIRYHNVSSKLLLLSNQGRLYMFDTRTLRVSYLRLSDKIIDFSINEISNTLYYVTASANSLLRVIRVKLLVDNDDVSVDDSMFYTVLSLYATHVARSRLTLDYTRESLYLFVLINEHMFTYEMKLSNESRMLLQLCEGSCSRNRKLQILRPWLDGGDDKIFTGNQRYCRSVNFFVSRDRLLDLEMVCPSVSPNVYRVEISRKSNWAQDFHRSNYTTREQTSDYLYSSLVDVNDLTIASNFVPLRLIVMKDRLNSTRYVHVEHVIYSNQEELEHHRAPSEERLTHANRRLLAQIDHAWTNVQSIDSMYVRSEQLFSELPFLINLMLKHRAVRKYHKLLNEASNETATTTMTTTMSTATTTTATSAVEKKTGIEYDKIPTINERKLVVNVRDNLNTDTNDESASIDDTSNSGLIVFLVILICLLLFYSIFCTVINVTYIRRLQRQNHGMREIILYRENPLGSRREPSNDDDDDILPYNTLV